jgi:hypothetical protein
MYEPRIREKQPEKELGGVIANFGRERFEEAKARAREFVQAPLQWIQTNQPVRKGVLLEALDLLRPGVEVGHEHAIQKWKRR